MKFGLDVPVSEEFADVRLLADLASEAEAAGWDGVFLQDVLNSYSPIVDPWIALGAVAQATERVRLGNLSYPSPPASTLAGCPSGDHYRSLIKWEVDLRRCVGLL